MFNPSLDVAFNGRRTRNHHHPPQPRNQHQQGNSAPFPPPTDAPSQAPPSAALSSSVPLRSASLPTPRQQGHQHRRATDAIVRTTDDGRGSGGSGTTINRATARHQGAVMYQGGAPGVGSGGGAAGGDSNNGGGCSRSPIAEAAERRGVGSGVETGGGEAGLGKGAGDAVDNELLTKSLDAVRHRVKHYRMYLKPSFQVSTPKGGVTRRVECNVRSRKKSFKPHASPPNSTPSCVPTKVHHCTKWHPVSILRFHSKARARRWFEADVSTYRRS